MDSSFFLLESHIQIRKHKKVEWNKKILFSYPCWMSKVSEGNTKRYTFISIYFKWSSARQISFNIQSVFCFSLFFCHQIRFLFCGFKWLSCSTTNEQTCRLNVGCWWDIGEYYGRYFGNDWSFCMVFFEFLWVSWDEH